MNGWSWHSSWGRAFSGTVGAVALCAGARLGGPRSRTLWTCAVAPDLALLYGITSARTAFDPLPRHAVRPYNVLHSPGVPLVLFGAARMLASRTMAVAACGWAAHIAVDRAFGYGPRASDGSRL
ncbi:DUF4260 family protein [Streptomyces oryzae]|uniref:DUF4260 family protein n=1 Tax=Streptomyces oryzae TaxID=1434886 RepID=A0ABS3XD00_9ACTN|nr:DUF4260 family protein [Streptomyces oryzae]MBO8193164.1 DUF4260 family protein [Streptomyces oryzae]